MHGSTSDDREAWAQITQFVDRTVERVFAKRNEVGEFGQLKSAQGVAFAVELSPGCR
jgi:hypothetical protein